MTAAAPAPKPAKARLPFRRRLWRWTKRLAVIGLVLAIVARLALPYVLPWALDRVGQSRGLAIGYERLHLSVLKGEVSLDGLDVRPLAEDPGGESPLDEEALFSVEFLDFDLDVSALFTGEIRVRRVLVDGVHARLQREADGTLELARYLTPSDETEDEGDSSATDDAPRTRDSGEAEIAEEKPLDFTSPVRIDALRLQHVRLHVVDLTEESPLDTELLADVRVSDVGADGPAKIHVDARSETLLDRLRVEGTLLGGERLLDADLSVRLDGLRPKPLSGFLSTVGLEPLAEELDARLDLVARGRAGETDDAAFAAELDLDGVSLRADADEALALDTLEIRIPRWTTGRIEVASIRIDGVRGAAGRLADGALTAAGLALRPVPASGDAGDDGSADDPSDDAESGPVTIVELGALEVTGGQLAWADAATAPPVDLALVLDRLGVEGLVLDPARPDAELSVDVRARAEGLAESLALDLRARPFSARITASVEYVAEGLTGTAIAPYLAAAGLAPDLRGGDAGGQLELWAEPDADGALRAGFEARELHLKPGNEGEGETAEPRPELRFDRIALDEVSVDAEGQAIRVGEFVVEGPRLEIARDAEGIVRVLGVRTLTPAEAAARRPVPSVPASTLEAPSPDSESGATSTIAAEPAPLPRIELARAAVMGASLRYTDASTSPPIDLKLESMALEVVELGLGGEADAGTTDRARISASLEAKGFARRLELDGQVVSRPGPLDVEASLRLDGEGLVTDIVDPLLAEAGIESLLEDGRLSGRFDATARDTDEGFFVTASATGLTFRDGTQELLALDAFELSELKLGDGETRIDEVTLRGPRVAVARDAEGGLRALGLRLAPPEAAGPAEAESPAPGPTSSSTSSGVESETTPAAFSLQRLALEGAEVAWSDAAVDAPFDTRLRAAGSLESVHLGEAGAPARFGFDVSLEGALDSMRLDGSFSLGEVNELEANLSGAGLRSGPLATYMPPNLDVLLEDGRLAGRVTLRDEPAAEGGRGLFALVEGFALRDGEGGDALAALERLRLAAPRLDSEGGVFQVEELTTEGLVLDVERTSPTRFELLGIALELDAPPKVVQTEEAPPADAAPTAVGGQDDLGTAAPRTMVVGLPGVAADALPTVSIDRLSLGIDRFRFQDRTAPDAVPLDLRAHLVTREPATLLAPDPEDLPPVRLAVEGAAPPFVGESALTLDLAPFAVEPYASVVLDVGGLSGGGLLEVLPELAETIDGEGLEKGRLTGRIDVTLDVQRRGAAAFDLSRGLGVVASVDDVAFRATPEGEVLLGVERVYVEAPRLRPTTGDLDVRTIEVTRPIARARRTAEGIEVLGLVLKNPPPAEEPVDGAPNAEAPPTDEVDAVLAEAHEPAPSNDEGSEFPPPVLRIRELLVSGADVLVEDRSVDPPVIVPITDLDVEVKNFSTAQDAGAVSLRMFVESGEVSLPERTEGDSLVTGLLGAAAGLVTGSGASFESEDRQLWDLLQVTGRLDLSGPAPKGFVTVELGAFELPAVRGLAKASGVDIGDGLVDTRSTVRLLGERGLRADTRTVFSKLFVSEPPGGPISKYLALPAPLDTVLYVLRDENEQQVIPLSVTIPAEGVSTGAVLGAVTKTLGTLIAEAIASSPLRLGSGLAGALGLLQEEAITPAGPPIPVRFAPLDTVCDAGARDALVRLAEELRRAPEQTVLLTHELGGGDLQLASQVTELDEATVLELGAYLRTTKATLQAERDTAAAELRGHLALGRTKAAEEAGRQLARIDARLLETEEALDEVFGLLRPGSARLAERRARSMATVLGEARMRAVRDILVRAGVSPARIESRRPRVRDTQGNAGGEVTVTPRN